MSLRLNILLLGDYSHCHATLAESLRLLGHTVTVASDGSGWMQTPYDINISRKNGKLGGLKLYLDILYPYHKKLKGYDIVAIHDPNFLSLRPEKLEKIFKRLKNENGNIFYTAMSTDVFYLDMIESGSSPLRYNEWFIEGRPSRWHMENTDLWESWHSPVLRNFQESIFENINGAVAVLYEYWEGLKYGLPAEKIGYGGIPVNTKDIKYIEPSVSGKIKILLGYDKTRKLMKGADYLEIAARNVAERNKEKVELDIVENIPYKQFIYRLSGSDIVLDQIYSYTPSTTPLIAMAMGKAVVSGAEPEYYDFICENENKPIVNAPLTVDELENSIESLIADRESLIERGLESRQFVEKHNDYIVVARRFLDFWINRMNA